MFFGHVGLLGIGYWVFGSAQARERRVVGFDFRHDTAYDTFHIIFAPSPRERFDETLEKKIILIPGGFLVLHFSIEGALLPKAGVLLFRDFAFSEDDTRPCYHSFSRYYHSYAAAGVGSVDARTIRLMSSPLPLFPLHVNWEERQRTFRQLWLIANTRDTGAWIPSIYSAIIRFTR